jgi:hypothetical protein
MVAGRRLDFGRALALAARTALAAIIVLAPQGASAQAPPPDPSTALLDRASAYVANYVQSLSSVVGEERYEQFVQRSARMTATTVQKRTLVSDYLLVLIPGESEWIPFRDVYSVDGARVRDRNNRLLKLFVESRADARQQAECIQDESSRYNIGSVTRDINVPTFALHFLLPQLRSRSVFRVKGKERIDGEETTIVEFEERASPTLVVGRDFENVPARGRFWVEPQSGRVLQTQMETRPSGMTTTIVVRYQLEAKLELWVPSKMDEKHKLGDESVEGVATYTNFRRFQVETTIDIKK